MKQKRLRLIYNLAIVLLLFIILYCFLLLKPLWKPVFTIVCIGLLPFMIGGFIAYLLHPIVKKIELLGINRIVAILAIYVLFFGGMGYALYVGIPVLIDQVSHFSEHIPELAGHYKGLVKDLHESTSRWPDGIQTQIEERVDDFEQWLNRFLEKTMSAFKGLINFIFVLAVIPFISFYILKDLDLIKKAAWYMTPKKWRKQGKEFLSAVNTSLGGYIRGQLLVCVLIGTISTLLFWLIGLDYPVIMGLIVAFTNIIPYFGPVIGAVPVTAFALLSSVKLALMSAGIIVLLQLLEGNVLSPYIVGRSINIHPLFIIAALIIGGEAGGVIGMLVAVPLLAILKVAVVHSRDYFIKAKQT
ncbi:AI-2E family transporter [Siminovitchia fortis]|uniref:AI-2E family transporter n=1 Tax=Siminovitchia fortis TaxID=254758 RepID=A0A443J3G5_9BACI|nr:AI-2E family transporter [Siminovitchia fortis]RWR15201.1 AI-2E family transporter [Siminovitchia fortis]WHY82658.1 AI-2E family transporter [Siminovitchia fortis]